MPGQPAVAASDRLPRHAHPVQTRGDGIRLTQAMAGKGVLSVNDRMSS